MRIVRMVAWSAVLALTPLAWQSPAAQGRATPEGSSASPSGQGAGPAQTVPAAQLSVCEAPRFIGAPIDVDYQGADLREVLRSVADFGGLNLVIDPQVSAAARVDLSLKQVPWDQVFSILVKTNQLGCEAVGSVVRVLPQDLLAKESKSRSDALAQQQDEEFERERDQRHFRLNYAKGLDIKMVLNSQGFLSKYANTMFDERTNTLVVVGLPSDLDKAAEYVKELDVAEPQVEIEARIVETDSSSAKSLGIQWGANGQMSSALGNTTTLGFPNSVAVGGAVQNSNGNPLTVGNSTAIVNLPAGTSTVSPTSAIGLSLGSINGALGLDAQLSALEQAGKTKILSAPKVTTQNNVPAEVTQGRTVPYQTTANNTVTVEFHDAALHLLVTPHINMEANTVVMDVSLENGSADFTNTVDGNPSIVTQKASTKVMVGDGTTTVIGGVVINSEIANTGKTPGLGNVPLLGWLFKRYDRSTTNNEILIFITPRIVRGVS